jgi:uncharacterized protein YndB with AHSA1/START domain
LTDTSIRGYIDVIEDGGSLSEREVGRTKDVGWQIGVRRTVPYSVEEVWDLLVSPEGLAVWLAPGAQLSPTSGATVKTDDGGTGEVRSYRPHDRVRVVWQPAGRAHDSTVQVALLTAATGTAIVFHEERLTGAEEREQRRVHWRRVLDRLEDALGR